MNKRLEQTFLQRRYRNGQQAYEKVPNNTNHKGNANQNHNELSPHTMKMATIKKTKTK